MDLLTPDEFRRLLEARADAAVSLYLPTHRAGPETAQDPVRLKNLLDTAESRLVDSGMRAPEARSLLSPVDDLLADGTFWSHQEDGLAVFAAADRFDRFRLPIRVPESARVSTRFHLAPLAPLIAADAEFYVLALAQNSVRLLRGTRFGVSEVELGDVPTSLVEALWYEDRERQLQFHQTEPSGRTGLAAVFHGHGLGADTADEEVVRFFRAVDAGVRHLVDPRAPIVLAGVAYLFPLYRRASQHPSIVDSGVEGNPEHLSPAELHRRALPMVGDLLARDRMGVEARFAAGTDPVASTIEEVVVAARQARVDTAFLPDTTAVWGRLDSDGTAVTVLDAEGDGAIDLTDDIAVHTWLNGGRVFVTDATPGGGPVAALLRF